MAAKRKPNRKTGICSALAQNLDDATLRFEVASREVNSTIGDILSGLNAPHELVVLWKDKERAYNRLEDYLRRGIVPEDLEIEPTSSRDMGLLSQYLRSSCGPSAISKGP